MPVSAYIIDFVTSHQSELVHGRQGKKIKRRKGIRGKISHNPRPRSHTPINVVPERRPHPFVYTRWQSRPCITHSPRGLMWKRRVGQRKEEENDGEWRIETEGLFFWVSLAAILRVYPLALSEKAVKYHLSRNRSATLSFPGNALTTAAVHH